MTSDGYLDGDLDLDDGDFEDQPEPKPTDPKELVRYLRKQLRAQGKELAEARGVHRELAFAKAGVDLSSKLGQMFAKSYDGDVNDVVRLVSEAAELGLIRVAASEGEL